MGSRRANNTTIKSNAGEFNRRAGGRRRKVIGGGGSIFVNSSVAGG